MKPQQQTRKAPDGDCLRACIASLLEYNIQSVPDFTQAPELPGSEYPAWWLALQSWLAERGLWFLEMQLTPGTPWMPLPLPALCIFFGETDKGIKHAVVGRVEEESFIPVFNPWPEAQITSGVGALGFLIPREPWMPIQLGKSLEKIVKLTKALPESPIADNIAAEVYHALGHDVVNGQKIISETFLKDGHGQS